jgi:hypothetical protein
MMFDEEILQLFFQDENYATSLLIISKQVINSVTVSPPKRHPVCAGCLLSKQVPLGHLDP